MAIRSKTVTIGTAATPLVSANLNIPIDLALTNNSGTTIYLGASNVTPTNGFPIPNGNAITLDNLDGTSQAYACVATGTAVLNVLEIGV